MMLEFARIASGLSLLVLPGAWVAFGLPLHSLTSYVRLAVAVALSPVVVVLQFYLLRWTGLPFETVAWVLVFANLGAGLLILRGWKGNVPAREILAAAAVFLVLCVCVVLPWITAPKIRVFTGHTFMHMGIIYEVARGALSLEDPELAGVRLAYPWLAHAYWAVLSWVLDWSPTRTYVLTNLWSLATAGLLFHGICQFLGAGSRASRVALLWLGLGTNGLGVLMWWLMYLAGRVPFLVGDSRYSTWLRKFTTLQMTAVAVCIFGVAVLSGLWARRTRRWEWFAVHLIAVAGLGFIYSVLLPLALVWSGLMLLAMWRDRPSRDLPLVAAGLAGVTGLAALFLFYVAASRSGSMLSLATPGMMMARVASSVVVLAPFLAALWIVRKKVAESGLAPLLATAAISILLAVFFRIGGDDHQYKFMFCTALLLAPSVALAVEYRFHSPAARWGLILAAVFLLAPVARFSMQRSAVGNFTTLPDINESRFAISLQPSEEISAWVRILAHGTPLDTVILTNLTGLSLPALVHRSLWVAPDHGGPGHWLGGRWNMVGVRGYREDLYEKRRQVVRTIFEGGAKGANGSELEPVRQLNRPIALVFGPGEGVSFQAYLETAAARKLYSEPDGYTVWLLPAPSAAASR